MKTILLVEDNFAIQDSMQLILCESGYHVIICNSAEEVILMTVVPNLYLIDKQLTAGIDGLNLCHILKANQKTKAVPIIMLSASPNIRQLAIEAGAHGAVEKPFKISHLLEQISLVLA